MAMHEAYSLSLDPTGVNDAATVAIDDEETSEIRDLWHHNYDIQRQCCST